MSMKSRSRVVFVNEASSLIGMGHILRSQVLARTMYSRGYGISTITIGDEKAALYAESRAEREQFEWPVKTTHESRGAIEYIMGDAPSVIVVDCARDGPDIVRACANTGIKVVALDYMLSDQPLPAAIINLIDHNPGTLAGCPPAREGVIYCEGPQYAIIRDEFLEERNRRTVRGERAVIKNILITFGGADPSCNFKRALEMITQWPGRFDVDIIVGPLFTSDVMPVADSMRHKCVITTHMSPNQIGKLFAEADLIICGGGGTLLEAMCVGTPAMVIPQNEAELRHAASLAEREACWLTDDVEWEYMIPVINREKRSICARACVDGRGAERICDVIEQQLYQE